MLYPVTKPTTILCTMVLLLRRWLTNLSKESLEMPPATCPSLEEQSQVWSSITNEYLNGLNEGFGTEDWVQTSMLGEEVGSYQDQEVFTGA